MERAEAQVSRARKDEDNLKKKLESWAEDYMALEKLERKMKGSGRKKDKDAEKSWYDSRSSTSKDSSASLPSSTSLQPSHHSDDLESKGGQKSGHLERKNCTATNALESTAS